MSQVQNVRTFWDAPSVVEKSPVDLFNVQQMRDRCIVAPSAVSLVQVSGSEPSTAHQVQVQQAAVLETEEEWPEAGI